MARKFKKKITPILEDNNINVPVNKIYYTATSTDILEGKINVDVDTKCFAEWDLNPNNFENMQMDSNFKESPNNKKAQNEVFPCIILDTRSSEKSTEYYIHYLNMNRRNDCWITRDKLCFYEDLTKSDQGFATNALNSVYVPPASTLTLAANTVSPDKEETEETQDEEVPPDEQINIFDKELESENYMELDNNQSSNNGLNDSESSDDDDTMALAIQEDNNTITKFGTRKMGDLTLLPPDDDAHGPSDNPEIRAHEEATRIKNIEKVIFGTFELSAWYYSPYPVECIENKTVNLCEFCLSCFARDSELRRHARKCNVRHPPGNEIYRSLEQNINIAVFEVDGRKERVYTQNLCLLSKLFLDHKTVQYDTDPFLFYILTEYDDAGYHIVAYFSKEKLSEYNYNLACILTLPCHQKKGYAYELSKIEKKIGSPEVPISDLGRVSYESYWRQTLINILSNRQYKISIDDISKMTSIRPQDIKDMLQNKMKLSKFYNGEWILDISQVIKLKEKTVDPKAIVVQNCDPSKLHWTPFVLVNKRQKTYHF